MKKTMTKLTALVCALSLAFALCACGSSDKGDASGKKTFKVGICNYVDDASLNQIAENIQSRLKELADENNVNIEVEYENCNADATVLNQIISDFETEGVDLMVGIATPVAMAMQAATEDSKTPVVFSAVSDPVGVGLVEATNAPGANVTGTSDALDTNAIMDIIKAVQPEVKKVALLYDIGQDSSTAAIKSAKTYLDSMNISYKDYTGSTTDEVSLAVKSLIADKVDAVFTPTDNTIMTAELSIYEYLAKAGIPHYTGADSFALNGAFLGYGVNYAVLGQATADMVYSILNGADPATTAVVTFENGIATVNSETCAALKLDYPDVEAALSPLCAKVQSIKTAESFEN